MLSVEMAHRNNHYYNYYDKKIEDRHSDYIQSHMYTFYGKQFVFVKYNEKVIKMKKFEKILPVLILFEGRLKKNT